MSKTGKIAHGFVDVRNLRYDATEFAQGVTEVLAYGTAVKITSASN